VLYIGGVLAGLYIIGALTLLGELRHLVGDDFVGEVGIGSWVVTPLIRGTSVGIVVVSYCVAAIWCAPRRIATLRRLRRVAAHVRNGGAPPATHPTESYIDGCVASACTEESTDFGRFLIRPYGKGVCACGGESAVQCGVDLLCRVCLRRMVAEHYEGTQLQRP
jgi:hypothetical protein